ncbi:hypothetical protein BC833DRAFT_532107 [Globomyces pollinis-pini]|nr:hypothetical protein BC833DRAFT_532107 [Globomyces pollinis-pini]
MSFYKTYLESLWFNYIESSDNIALRLTLLMCVWHEIVTIPRILPYIAIDFIPWFKQFKIQQAKTTSKADYWTLIKHSFVSRLFSGIIYPVTVALNFSTKSVFPEVSEIILSLIFFVVVQDFLYYFMHRALHWGPLYKHIHKKHHEFTHSNVLVSEYSTTAEALCVAFEFFFGPAVLSYFRGMHVIQLLLWFAVRIIQSIDCHSGYDFPWSLHHYIPVWAGAEFHDYHHSAFVGNYGSFFRFWYIVINIDM